MLSRNFRDQIRFGNHMRETLAGPRPKDCTPPLLDSFRLFAYLGEVEVYPKVVLG